MLAKPKSNSIITHVVSVVKDLLGIDKCVITFTIKDAEGAGRPGRFEFDMSKVHPDMQRMAAIHGFIQRISDGAAMSRNKETGRPATPAEKMARMLTIADHYAAGADQWTMNKGTGEGRSQGPNIVIRALAAIQGTSVAEALASVREKAEKGRMTTKALLKKLATSKAIVDKVAELRAAESVVAEDGDEMLADLLSGGSDTDESMDETEGEAE